MQKRILIGSCGGLTGSYLARRFREKGYYVVGADATEKNVTAFFTDAFVALPKSKDPAFCDELLKALREYQIDYYFPTHSQEMRTVAANEAYLRENWGEKFIISPHETFLKLDGKKAATQSLESIGIPTPKLIPKNAAETTFPIFMKPDIGSGSKKTLLIETETLWKEYARLDPGYCFYEVIRGTEFTVDCLFDTNGKLLAYNQRIRVKNMGGGAIIAQNNYDFDILPYLKKLEQAFVFKGCVNFQYILSNGIPYFIDVNLRYASGGLPLTVASGVDVLQVLIDLLDGKKVEPIPCQKADRLTMYRYFEELYQEEKL